jgi:electron transfer flavoprotein alpha subunit
VRAGERSAEGARESDAGRGDRGAQVDVLVLGSASEAAAKFAAGVAGVRKVLHASDKSVDHGLAEPTARAALDVQKAGGYTHVLFPATNFGKNVAPRVAAKLDSQQISEVIKVHAEDTFERPTYAGNALAKVKSKDAIKVLTVRGTAFEKAATSGGSGAVEAAAVPSAAKGPAATFVSEEKAKSDRPELTSASVVVSGGRALKSADNFPMLYALADKLRGAVGASRAAVDAGFCSNDLQIGQTGKIVAPDLYIAIGISGAIQHIAGMKDSKVIVAINKDAEAPIFQIADYGLVGDLFQIIPELTQKLPQK